MTIKAERYTKDGLTTVLEFGTGRGEYFVKLDDVVIAQSTVHRSVWDFGLEARAMLVSTGWKKA